MEELKSHKFFDGICWDTLRTESVPDFTPRQPSPPDDELDWDLKSLAEAIPMQYQYIVNVDAQT